MITEHELIVVMTPLPDFGLVPGDLGTVVHVYEGEAAYEIEFTTLTGDSLAVVTLEASAVRPVGRDVILHARKLDSNI